MWETPAEMKTRLAEVDTTLDRAPIWPTVIKRFEGFQIEKMGVLGCAYTYNVNFILTLFTNLCLCFLCLQVIINLRVSDNPVK